MIFYVSVNFQSLKSKLVIPCFCRVAFVSIPVSNKVQVAKSKGHGLPRQKPRRLRRWLRRLRRVLGLQAAVGHRQLASAEGDPASTVRVAFGHEAREVQLIWTVWVVHGPATLEEFAFQVWRRILDEDCRARSELFMIQGVNSIRRNLAFHMSRVSKQLPEGLLGKITLADKKNECQTSVSGRDPIQCLVKPSNFRSKFDKIKPSIVCSWRSFRIIQMKLGILANCVSTMPLHS